MEEIKCEARPVEQSWYIVPVIIGTCTSCWWPAEHSGQHPANSCHALQLMKERKKQDLGCIYLLQFAMCDEESGLFPHTTCRHLCGRLWRQEAAVR